MVWKVFFFLFFLFFYYSIFSLDWISFFFSSHWFIYITGTVYWGMLFLLIDLRKFVISLYQKAFITNCKICNGRILYIVRCRSFLNLTNGTFLFTIFYVYTKVFLCLPSRIAWIGCFFFEFRRFKDKGDCKFNGNLALTTTRTDFLFQSQTTYNHRTVNQFTEPEQHIAVFL